MKRAQICLAGMAFLLSPIAAQAADIAAETPAIYDWTGFFVGANAGYGFGGDDPIKLEAGDLDKVGDLDSELFREFFVAFAQNAGVTLHVENLYGRNNHHIAETCFKALARVLRAATAVDARQKGRVPSTKGSLAG